MDPGLLHAFQIQALYQAKFVLFAVKELTAALVPAVRDVDRVFFALEALLNAVANLSKAFWGPGGRFSAQRKPLRDSVGLSDESALRDVGMRNHFQHFDERLDRWWKESKNHNYIDMSLSHGGFPTENVDRFRRYIPETGELWFWGERYDIKAICTEVSVIGPKLEAEVRKPPWKK